jgi:hypothetical protein
MMETTSLRELFNPAPNFAPGEVLALQSRLLYVSLESSHSETKEEDYVDTYSKAVLTVIAVGVWAIAIKLFVPDIGGSTTGAPMFGQFMNLQDIQDQTKREETRKRLLRSVPVVRVHGGFIDVSGSVNANE